MRTDDDSWDITESVGATAIGVAAMRAYETDRADALFHDPYAAKLVEAVGSENWTAMLRGTREDPREQGGSFIQGVMGYFLIARTLYFDKYFADAIEVGVRQFVILASGLDARAYRMQWPSGSVVFELDQPRVLDFKAKALAADTPAVDRRELPIDLRQDWPKALLDKGFDPTRPTAWLAEGLLRYLPGDAQDRLLGNVAELSAPGSRMALNIGTGERALSDEFRKRRAEALAEAGIRVDLEQLWYPWEGRTDPRTWFAMHGWLVREGDPAALLEDRGRTVVEAALPDLSTHILMTAIRPRGDDTL
ncbi:class I SAM-dependent methyltransferase [Nocardia sp. NBC_01503]|uniref:class I SAM-dependent methyltransferase n=1 Tax=Nocardia sp. NBC_01503 TaxID=2975997 RepID=UPI002E7C3C8E|nr:class I SAM-dependent methyltransferase [Nocardia sp. NBC_01503]WTL32282.1 class I SAM-dependent methyltransferase [Nocardia sp. NBC_01503]